MQRWRVDSSMFIALSYEARTQTVEFELHSGEVWRHRGIPPGMLEQMLRAPSKGKYYHAWIRGAFERELVCGVGGRALASAPG